jgi:hypothetical protein
MCVWLGGMMIFFQGYNLLKAQITPHKNKKYMFFYINPTKKFNYTSKSNTPKLNKAD